LATFAAFALNFRAEGKPAFPRNPHPTVEKNLANLIEKFQQAPSFQRLLRALERDEPRPLLLSGFKGAQAAFYLAALYAARPRTHLFIAPTKEDAAYLQNTLSGLLHKGAARFFPDSFKRPLFFEKLNTAHILERTEVVNALSAHPTPQVVVSYPEALFEKVVAPSLLAKNRIEIKTGEAVDLDFLIEMLGEYGFRREEFVYEPGQFAVRGGIVDIFSYGNEYPYRLELFDEEVESIRTFDPLTQLSIRNIAFLSIVPNQNTRFEGGDKVSLLEALPTDSLVWVADLGMLLDRMLDCFEKADAFAPQAPLHEDPELEKIFRDRAFLPPNALMSQLERFPLLLLQPPGEHLRPAEELSFQGVPQPSFNKNFSLLIEHLQGNQRQGLENYLFTDNPKQVDRFEAIFHDLDARVQFHPVLHAIHAGFVDPEARVACYTDHQIFQRFHKYRLRQGFTKDKALNLRLLRDLQPGDFVVHIDHGIGRYSGLEKIEINGHVQESVRLFYKNKDVLYVSINALHKISKYVGKDGTPPKLSKLGSDAWARLKHKTKKKVKDIAGELIKLYARRKASAGFAFPPDGYLQNELEASFLYEDTPDQLKATQDVKEDMCKPCPMDRLVCGDVGFGKTEVAVRAAFKAVVGGKQVAVLVPTTILALQHFKTFRERLEPFGVKVEFVNRFKTAAQKRRIFEELAEGRIEIIIGTHALLGKQVQFKDLGLLIIDEEQKFGVAAKEKLRSLKVNVDTLTLTATPIPRTLQFSLMAARDLSIIRTPPPNRQPIHTEVRVFNEEVIRDAIYFEVHRGGQVFFVHNRVKTLPQVVAMLRRLCPDVDIAMAHGQMDNKELERTLIKFIEGEYDVLVSTNIVENGLDIPNANTIIIHDAHQFGLSDLHQLRGRVGRSNKKAYCYLFSPPKSVLTPDARKRLQTIEEFSELGSGFEIAMRDLDIRGAGNLLGAEQSGFIAEIGYETFQKILEEAIQELKENEFKELFAEELEKRRDFVREVQIDTDAEMLIPDEYVSSTQERLSLYTELDKIEDETTLSRFGEQLRDRFGPLPPQVEELFEGLRLRWEARALGFERIILKKGKLRCYFVENPQSPYYESRTFQRVFQLIGSKGKQWGLHIKKSPRHLLLVKEGVRGLRQARHLLQGLLEEVQAAEGEAALPG